MKKRIITVVPRFVREIIHRGINNRFTVIRTKEMAKLPALEISEIHIVNARLLTDRTRLLEMFPTHSVGAELGVDSGNFSIEIIKLCKPQKLHLIDYWGTKRYGSDKKDIVKQLFEKEIREGKVEINLGLSVDVANQFPDAYFDWIYIDTDHSYETTKNELESYRLKIKSNGIIAGHDFILGNWKGMVLYGVIQAVYEFCVKYDWEIIYLTMEVDFPPSFAIREISVKNS